MTLQVQIASVPDRESLVAEIWLLDEMLAEIRLDDAGETVLEIHNNRLTRGWSVGCREFLDTVASAMERLRPGEIQR